MSLSFVNEKNAHDKIQLLIYNLFNLLWSALMQESLYLIIKKLRSNRELKMLSLLCMVWEAYSLSASENLIQKRVS